MLLGEVLRTCANERVAHAAVASIGRRFLADVTDHASACDLSVGAYTALSVDRFLRHGDESELRCVVTAMHGSQEPVLAGLHSILRIMIASTGTAETRRPARAPRVGVQLCAWEAERRDLHA